MDVLQNRKNFTSVITRDKRDIKLMGNYQEVLDEINVLIASESIDDQNCVSLSLINEVLKNLSSKYSRNVNDLKEDINDLLYHSNDAAEFESFLNANIEQIPAVNANFYISINPQKSIRASVQPESNEYQIFLELYDYQNWFACSRIKHSSSVDSDEEEAIHHYNDGHMMIIASTLDCHKKEIFEKICIHLDDCPEWLRKALTEKRQEELKTKKTKVKTLL